MVPNLTPESPHTFHPNHTWIYDTGYPDGYPVVFDTHLTEKRAAQALSFIRDGGYLSATMTASLTVEVTSAGL